MLKLFNGVMQCSVIASLLLPAGCASVRAGQTADGRDGYSVNCSGVGRTWAKCYTAADELCRPKGYDILNRSRDETIGPGEKTSGIGAYLLNNEERILNVACKK